MKRLGIIGQRGMVGSVLMGRMREEGDFDKVKTTFFSTSQAGEQAPKVTNGESILIDAYDLNALSEMDFIITCQGGDYTNEVYDKLRSTGWSGYWIDAASSLRMKDDACLILDPINSDVIEKSIDSGVKTFVGANCTVSLLLMGIGGLFKEGLVEWVSSMTYQAASGAGARNMKELITQMNEIHQLSGNLADNILEIDKRIDSGLKGGKLTTDMFGAPLAGSLIPWIDRPVDDGQSKEEWKAMVEANKILNTAKSIPIDGTCVRIGAMRSHSQGLTIKLNKDIELKTVEDIIKNTCPWTEFVDNDKELTLEKLTPAYATGTLKVPVGRVRKMKMGGDFINAFTVGDQLLWGAAEPLRRMLMILLK